VGGCDAPNSRARVVCPRRAVPAVDATVAIGWLRPRAARWQQLCGHGGARRGGADTAVVERKAARPAGRGRRGREEGVREARRSVVVAMRFGDWSGAEEAHRNEWLG
jgi:hypothetical protein